VHCRLSICDLPDAGPTTRKCLVAFAFPLAAGDTDDWSDTQSVLGMKRMAKIVEAACHFLFKCDNRCSMKIADTDSMSGE
jgi:hypothetical protein